MWDDKSSLFRIRKGLGFSQKDIGERMNVSQMAVSNLERRGPEDIYVELLARYVAALGGQLHLEIVLPGQDPIRWEMT